MKLRYNIYDLVFCIVFILYKHMSMFHSMQTSVHTPVRGIISYRKPPSILNDKKAGN